jgi:hypothetical protein
VFIHINYLIILIFVRFEVFTAVSMKNAVFWYVASCRSCVNRRFVGTYRFHLQGRKIRERGISVSRWLLSTPKAEAARSVATVEDCSQIEQSIGIAPGEHATIGQISFEMAMADARQH